MVDARPTEDAHAEIREIIESGLAKLKGWMDVRFQQEEQLLRQLSSGGEFRMYPEGEQGMVEKDSMCFHVKEGHLASRIAHSKEGSNQGSTTTAAASPKEGVTADSTEAEPFLPNAIPEGSPESQLQEHKTPVFCIAEKVEFSTGAGEKPETTMTDYEPPTAHVPRDLWKEQEWKTKLADIFDQLDLDNTGSVDRSELMEAFEAVGMPEMQDVESLKVFKAMDRTDNGSIDRVEWLHITAEAAKNRDDGEEALLFEFLDRLVEMQKSRGRIYLTNRKKRLCCILRHDSAVRMTWDLGMVVLLFYVSLSVPFSLGFIGDGDSKALDICDLISDLLFCFDVVLNFRTTFTDTQDDSVVVDGTKIALRYLKTWFALDFVSSVPFDLITGGLLPNLTPARLLKFFKITKVMKLLRISRLLRFAESDWLEKLDQILSSKGHQTFLRVVKLAAIAYVVAHWLACFGNAVDNASLDVYFSGETEQPTVLQKYLAGLYWATTTLSTVGYGDITPKSDRERAYAMFAMIIGGSLYGYVIGCVTSMVTDMDVSSRAFQERMENIQSWLDGHDDIPPVLRRRMRKYFKRALSAKSVMDDSTIIKELSPSLRADTAFFLVNDHVKLHPMFLNIPNSALAKLVDVLQKSHANVDECIVEIGDPGTAMYILVEGRARYKEGLRWQPPDTKQPNRRFQQIAKGDSFGEEIIFGLAETYSYTITTMAECEFHSIGEDGFKECYQNMPELTSQMIAAFLQSRGSQMTGIQHQPEPWPQMPSFDCYPNLQRAQTAPLSLIQTSPMESPMQSEEPAAPVSPKSLKSRATYS